MGYHKAQIKKGILGKTSKIQEEIDELVDAEQQGVKILVHCELADLYGALKARAAAEGLTMDDLKSMCELTESAFREGTRK